MIAQLRFFPPLQPRLSALQGAEREALIKELHRIKTDIFMEMIESGALPLRPGVKRLVMEAMAGGLPRSLNALQFNSIDYGHHCILPESRSINFFSP